MHVEFRHCNPHSGNESVVLRFTSHSFSQSPCVLIDSGDNVDLDSILGESDYLAGILLTHAHSDHYRTLPDNLRDGAAVYTSPATARVLSMVYENSDIECGAKSLRHLEDSIRGISTWEDVTSNIRVRPIPAGHTPGACGFFLEFKSGSEWKTIAISGDFTLNRSGGYPAFPNGFVRDVDALIVTGATSEEDDRPELIYNAFRRAEGGQEVLVTTTGLTGVELAYQFGNLSEVTTNVPIRIVGQLAKLYNQLDYDVPNVNAVETFENPSEVMEIGEITLAGPQVPTEGGSGRIYEHIRSNSNATVLQLTNGTKKPIYDGSCTIQAYTYVPHPTQHEVDNLVNNIQPIEVVVTHQRQTMDRYKQKFDQSFVWALTESSWFTLWESSEWRSPPWMTPEGNDIVRKKNKHRSGTSILGEAPDPELLRDTEFNLEAEGLPSNLIDRISGFDSNTEFADTKYSTQPQTADTDTSTNGSTAKHSEPQRIKARMIELDDGEFLMKALDTSLDSYEHGDEVFVELSHESLKQAELD